MTSDDLGPGGASPAEAPSPDDTFCAELTRERERRRQAEAQAMAAERRAQAAEERATSAEWQVALLCSELTGNRTAHRRSLDIRRLFH